MHPFRSALETARVGDRELHGCDFLHVGADGLIDEFTVMVRPLSALTALAEAMGAEIERATAELAGGPQA